ncbi:unnamed protein product, partial [Polarella glacialis]
RCPRGLHVHSCKALGRVLGAWRQLWPSTGGKSGRRLCCQGEAGEREPCWLQLRHGRRATSPVREL